MKNLVLIVVLLLVVSVNVAKAEDLTSLCVNNAVDLVSWTNINIDSKSAVVSFPTMTILYALHDGNVNLLVIDTEDNNKTLVNNYYEEGSIEYSVISTAILSAIAEKQMILSSINAD